jgi:hypothetical protein
VDGRVDDLPDEFPADDTGRMLMGWVRLKLRVAVQAGTSTGGGVVRCAAASVVAFSNV